MTLEGKPARTGESYTEAAFCSSLPLLFVTQVSSFYLSPTPPHSFSRKFKKTRKQAMSDPKSAVGISMSTQYAPSLPLPATLSNALVVFHLGVTDLLVGSALFVSAANEQWDREITFAFSGPVLQSPIPAKTSAGTGLIGRSGIIRGV